MHNYFTSVQLADNLLAAKNTLVRIIRKNWKDVPKELLLNHRCEEKSASFVLINNWLISYSPKKGKEVILIFSMYHDKTVIEDEEKKPDIIIHYNETFMQIVHLQA